MKKDIEKKISIIIPCYGSEKTIENVVDCCVKTLETRTRAYEIVLVNDCSPDCVWDKIIKLSNKYRNKVVGINFTRNFGQHAALMAGYRESTGDITVAMDDDGQTNPKDLWKLVDKLDEGYDVVIAKYPEFKESVFRQFGSLVNKKMAEILVNKPKNIRGSSYMAMNRYIVNEIINYNKSFPYLGGLIFRSTQNIGEVDIDHHERLEGNSGYTLKKLIGLIMNGFTAFSVKPLRISSLLGCLFAMLGFVYGLIVIVRKLINPNVQLGYSSIMSALLFISGTIMLMLGLIGEYIGRIYISINNAPQYVIKEKIK